VEEILPSVLLTSADLPCTLRIMPEFAGAQPAHEMVPYLFYYPEVILPFDVH
jgi:hypothetical protein